MANLDRWMGEEVEWLTNLSISEYNGNIDKARFYIRRMEDVRPEILLTPHGKFTKSMFRNGGFVYVDLELVETCTPECRNHFEMGRYNKAMEVYMYAAAEELRQSYGAEVNAWKYNVNHFDEFSANRSAREGHEGDFWGQGEYMSSVARGTHESYDTDRAKFRDKVRLMIPYLTFRQLFAGAGGYYGDKYVISPRAMLTTALESSESRIKRPILGLKDEQYASTHETSNSRYRFHQVCGDGLRGDVPNLLKYGVTSYMIGAIEEGIITTVPHIHYPVGTLHEIATNTGGPWKIELKDSREKVDVVDYLNSYVLHPIEKLFEVREVQPHDKLTLDKFKFVLDKFSQGLVESAKEDVEWVNKKLFVDKAIDLFDFPTGYTDLRKRQVLSLEYVDAANPDVWLNIRQGMDLGGCSVKSTVIYTDRDMADAVMNPPKNSRAAFRAYLAKKYNDLNSLDWGQARRDRMHLRFLETDGWCEEEYERRSNGWLFHN